jgi:rhodanese-related sulfurtransferase
VIALAAQELASKCQAGEQLELIDVRTPLEFQEVHSIYARNMPLSDLEVKALLHNREDKPLYVICLSGARGMKACEAIQNAGFTNVFNVEGGTKAWVAAGLPVNQGKKVISLERQVRIAAGSLVVAGVALGWFVHPYFLGLSALVGVGLVVAGITDNCGMGMILARMPWNQVSYSKKPV